MSDRRTALGLHTGLRELNADTTRFLPLRKAISDTDSLHRLSEMAGGKFCLSDPFVELSVSSLASNPPQVADVLVVRRNLDRRKDTIDAVKALQYTNRHILGVILLD